MTPDVVEAYAALRRDHPARPLPRDLEEWMILEIVRLRDEVAMLQQEARIRKNLCDGFASEAAEERAAVVAWLRRGDECCVANADRIERGEHHSEEKEE